MWIFTVTAGRTGTAWLTKLISENLGIEAVHEHIGVDDIGLRTPDIRVMRNFNTHGANETVNAFWSHKLVTLPVDRDYFESNHTLAKAGLVEALAAHAERPPTALILLRRERVDQILSYLMRQDFINRTILWQWYLDPDYPRRLIDPKFLTDSAGLLGAVTWYVLEMEARQEYYRILFSDSFEFIDCRLEDAATDAGARLLLGHFGFSGEPSLPAKTNVSDTQPSPDDRARVREFLGRVDFDAVSVAKEFVENGNRL